MLLQEHIAHLLAPSIPHAWEEAMAKRDEQVETIIQHDGGVQQLVDEAPVGGVEEVSKSVADDGSEGGEDTE